MKIAIIGGGAAGFFAAVNIKKLTPLAEVTIYEGSHKVLTKVGVSGGGRCNLSNSFEDIKNLVQAYPRGEKLMKRAFKIFDQKNTYDWFEENGVKLTTQSDNCVFPVSQDSQEIIDTLLALAKKFYITVKTDHKISSIEKLDSGFVITTDNPENPTVECDIVVVTTGGSPRIEGLSMLDKLPLDIEKPVPSLFSFNIPDNSITELTGAVIENATVGIQGTKTRVTGSILITHWGVSGPAILKLSSYAARTLSDMDYEAKITVNWVSVFKEQEVLDELEYIAKHNSQKYTYSARPYNLTARFWEHILLQANVSRERRWAELGRKGVNRIVNALMADEYTIDGKSTFKEEFVTCGGVSLQSINQNTMEAKDVEDLYLAGEVLDIDAITGGFNLQAAWSTAYVVADSIAQKASAKI